MNAKPRTSKALEKEVACLSALRVGAACAPHPEVSLCRAAETRARLHRGPQGGDPRYEHDRVELARQRYIERGVELRECVVLSTHELKWNTEQPSHPPARACTLGRSSRSGEILRRTASGCSPCSWLRCSDVAILEIPTQASRGKRSPVPRVPQLRGRAAQVVLVRVPGRWQGPVRRLRANVQHGKCAVGAGVSRKLDRRPTGVNCCTSRRSPPVASRRSIWARATPLSR